MPAGSFYSLLLHSKMKRTFGVEDSAPVFQLVAYLLPAWPANPSVACLLMQALSARDLPAFGNADKLLAEPSGKKVANSDIPKGSCTERLLAHCAAWCPGLKPGTPGVTQLGTLNHNHICIGLVHHTEYAALHWG